MKSKPSKKPSQATSALVASTGEKHLKQRASIACLQLKGVVSALVRRGAHQSKESDLDWRTWSIVHDALCDATQLMNQHAMKNPRAFSFAESRTYWPVVRSPGSGLNKGQVSERVLFERLKVGEATELKVAGTNWNPNDNVGRYALDLLQRVHNGRLFDCPLDGDDPKEMHKLAAGFRKRAQHLQGFGEGSEWQAHWEKYHALAVEIVDREWEDPEKNGHLQSLVKAASKKSGVNQDSAARRGRKPYKSHLKTMLRDRFRSMAGGNKV